MRQANDRTSTRRDILQLLRQRGGMTAQQLAAELDITSMGVRRHLLALERDGFVRVDVRRMPAGRPAFIYSLTDEGYDTFPRGYDRLANQLLESAQAREGQAKVDALFAGRMDQLVAQYEPRMRGKDLAGRVAELARIQEENGYMAVWEKTEGGFFLREQNCAIYRVACRFQAACHYEVELFRRLLDVKIERVEHQVKGDLHCTYFVSEAGADRKRKRARR